MPRPRKRKHYVLVARPRIETAIVEVTAHNDDDAEQAALVQARRLPASAWSPRPFDPAEYQPHVETMIADDEFPEGEQPSGRRAADLLAEDETRYVLLQASCDGPEGDVLLQPWLVIDEPDLLASDLARDWIGSLQKLGLTHLSERLDDLTGGSPVKPSDRVLFAPRRRDPDDDF